MTNQHVFSNTTVIELIGSDAKNFLTNQIISQMPETNEPIYSAICNPKGRILYSLFIIPTESSIKVVVDQQLSDNFLHYITLRKFRMAFQVKQTNEHLSILASSEQPVSLQLLTTSSIDTPKDDVKHDDYFWQMMFELNLPWITKLTTELFIPQHLNLDQNNVIAFNKGCYPGQEIVARLHFIGKVKKRMQLLKLAEKLDCKAGENSFIAELNEEVQSCSPVVKLKNHWCLQAILPC